MFHQRTLNLEDLPSRWDPSQYYVHWTIESPAWNSLDRTDLKHFSNFFNLTMTYRQDSDFPAPRTRTTSQKNSGKFFPTT